MRDIIQCSVAGLIIVTLQWLFFGRLSLWGSTPDVVLLFVIWVSLRYGQIGGALAGFFVGFGLDAIYGLWGTHMFVKTLLGFLIGTLDLIESEVFERSQRRIVEITLIVALIHNIVFFMFILIQDGISREGLALILCLGNTLYTTFVAYILAVFRRR
ncbi:MAG: rod shape-determining protein MreD [Bacteroidetes bacterium]|nr:rod shape-determining protein MreD [Bacteroidota bacterium]